MSLTEPAPTIVELLRRSFNELTPTEKKVARTILARYPAAGLTGVTEIAAESKSSTATVIRLVQKLGFEGYATFHSALLDELSTREAGPRDRLATSANPAPGTLSALTEALSTSVAAVAATVPASEYDATVDLLVDPRRRVFTMGGRVSQTWAEMFGTYLGRLRRDVSVMSRDRGRRVASLLDMSNKSVLVAFDFRRYDEPTLHAVIEASQRHATVVLVTDVWLSPAASYADIVLPVPVQSPSPFDTSLTALALVESLTWSVVQRMGDEGGERMRQWDAIARH